MFDNERQMKTSNSRSIFNEESSNPSLSSSSVDDFEIVGYDNQNKNMSDEEVQWNSSINSTNKNVERDNYLKNANSFKINSALRTLQNPKRQDDRSIQEAINTISQNRSTIVELDKATRSNVFINTKYLYRMVQFNFLEGNFGISVDSSEKLNSVLNKITSIPNFYDLSITEPGFTSCSYEEFKSGYCNSFPVELIIHCEPGETYYQTDNYSEAEVILPRNITFGILSFPEIVNTTHGDKIVIELYRIN